MLRRLVLAICIVLLTAPNLYSETSPQTLNGYAQCEPTDDQQGSNNENNPVWRCVFHRNAEANNGHKNTESAAPDTRLNPLLTSLRDWIVRAIDDPVAFFTLVLAISTILLWWTTRQLLMDAKNQGAHMEILAKAASKNADVAERSLIGIERPFMFVSIEPHQLSYPYDADTNFIIQFPSVRYSFTNYGKTPAIIDHVVILFFPYPYKPPLPADEFHRLGIRHPRVRYINPVIAPMAKTPEFTSDMEFPFSLSTRKSVVTEETFVWFYGYIHYGDRFNDRHWTYFCYRYNRTTGVMIRYGDEAYNHTKTESPHDPGGIL